MEMGTGKTRIGIHALEKWMAENDVKLVLVVNILTGLHVWAENWHEWATYPVLFIDLHETGVEGLKKAKQLSRNGYPVICLVNFEMAWQLGYKRIPRIRSGQKVNILEAVDTTLHDVDWDAVLIDESTGIKSPSARVTKFMINKVKPRARYRMVLTGSAYTKRPLDVYSQLKFILPENTRLIPPTFTHFKAKYSIPNPRIRGAVIGYQNIPDLVEKMAECCVMLKKEDVLDLPPAVHETRMIILPPKVKKVYEEISQQLYSELEGFEAEGGTVSVNHVFAVMRKQAQITSGFIKMDPVDGEEAKLVTLHDLKIQETLDILDNRGGKPTIIVTQADYEEVMLAKAIWKRFNFRSKILNGGVHGSEARHKMTKAAGKDMCYIVKEAVGAKSIDMRWADMTIFYSHSPNTINYDQMLSRNHRGGQDKNITYMHLLCKGTVDMRIMKTLERDLDMARQIEKDWRKLVTWTGR